MAHGVEGADMMLLAWFAGVALAREVTLKVHDMAGALAPGSVVTVTVHDPSTTEVRKAGPWTPRDDGVAPDSLAGDKLYTARIPDLSLETGEVTVSAGGRTWTGGYAFEASSDPVLLVGLESSGFAAASTRELSFLAAVPTGGAPAAPGGPGNLPPPPGMAIPGMAGNAPPGAGPTPGGEGGRTATPARTTPKGTAAGWGLFIGALGLLAGVAWAGGRTGARRVGNADGVVRRGTAEACAALPGTRVWIGPPEVPGEIALDEARDLPEVLAARVRGALAAALAGGGTLHGPLRVVVADPRRVDGTVEALAGALGPDVETWVLER
jgi:hypothetical protein